MNEQWLEGYKRYWTIAKDLHSIAVEQSAQHFAIALADWFGKNPVQEKGRPHEVITQAA